MSLVSTPYRWLPRTFLKNLSHWYWDIRTGVRNLWIFFEAVWWFRSFDCTGLLGLMEVAAKRMAVCQQNGYHVGKDKYARQLRVLAELCRRLRKDDYGDMHGYRDGLTNLELREVFKRSNASAKNDALYLGRLLRFVQHWWD